MNTENLSIKKVGLGLIVLLLILEFVFFPWIDWLDSSKSELQGLKTFVAKQHKALDSASTIKTNITAISEQLQTFQGIPNIEKDQDAALFWLNAVDAVLAKYEVSVGNKAPTREVNINEKYGVYTGRLSVTGEYNIVLNLLYELESIEQGNRVRQVSIYQDKARKGHVRANIEFIRVFTRQ